jgi:release factor glutamine methyltransferase
VLITDSSSRALDVARANIAGLPFGAGPRVSARLGSWYDAVQPGERFDLIVSNPPYLALDDPEVAASVVDHEPAGALFAGADGLSALRVVLSGAPDHLVPGGAVLCEIGHRQGDAVRAIAHAAGLQVVEVGRDLAGRDRWILAVSPSYASGTAT